MRKLSIPLLGLLLFFSCKKNSSVQDVQASAQEIAERSCASQQVLASQLASDPALRNKLNQIEEFTKMKIASGEALRVTAGKTIEIPVVVHVLWNSPEQNISDAQIQSQIDVLNEDFNLRNRDKSLVPDLFANLTADVGVKFTLAQTIRKYTSFKTWPITDNMKFEARGGSNSVDPAHNLNIWVCNIGQGVLGFAYYPGIRAELDGVVVLYSAFGRTGTLEPRFNKGRTATHEVGHWLNLRHVWGDATCGTDLVDDTPQHTTANTHCPEFPHNNSCSDG